MGNAPKVRRTIRSGVIILQTEEQVLAFLSSPMVKECGKKSRRDSKTYRDHANFIVQDRSMLNMRDKLARKLSKRKGSRDGEAMPFLGKYFENQTKYYNTSIEHSP